MMGDLSRYKTDKIKAGYLEIYKPLVTPLVGVPMTLLELGVLGGESLRLWRDYFPQGTIVGLDVNPVAMEDASDRVHIYQGPQDDTDLLNRIASTHAPNGFDVIIDDASHLAGPTRISFWHLFREHLRTGGVYVIEDWGTGYWSDWSDGERRRWWKRRARHEAGMVGLVKELVDEVGAADLTRGALRNPPGRASRFRQMILAHGICAVVKA